MKSLTVATMFVVAMLGLIVPAMANGYRCDSYTDRNGHTHERCWRD